MGSGGYFLPFTESGKATELLAIEVKKRLGVGAYDAVDPYQALEAIPARLVDPNEIRRSTPQSAEILFREHQDEWSAIGYGLSPTTGESLILLNPTHHPHRRRVSLMEEIVHIVRDHPKTQLALEGWSPGSWARPYHAALEDEAYCVGAACIIPYKHLFEAVHRVHESAVEIAARFEVSPDYATYRINRAGLSRVYAKHHASPGPRWSLVKGKLNRD